MVAVFVSGSTVNQSPSAMQRHRPLTVPITSERVDAQRLQCTQLSERRRCVNRVHPQAVLPAHNRAPLLDGECLDVVAACGRQRRPPLITFDLGSNVGVNVSRGPRVLHREEPLVYPLAAMYKELTADDLLRILNLGRDELPDVLLLVGIFDVHAGAERFAGYLDEAVSGREGRQGLPSWLGKYRGLRVAVAGCFGGPMAALHAHTWCGAGVPAVIQLGWFGALQPGTKLGDVIVPRHAERQDGVSDWYLPKGILSDASPALSAAITQQLRSRGIAVSEHAIYSTPALLAESREVIADWSRHGYQGVDMETAATFAVAKSLGVQRAAALIRYDDLIEEEHSLADELAHEHLAVLRNREREVVHAALDALLELRDAPAAATS
jgi:uridine phosphorylase